MDDRDSRPERRAERSGYAGRHEGGDARPESANAAHAETKRQPPGDRLLTLEVDEQEANAAVDGLDGITRQIARGDGAIDGRTSPVEFWKHVVATSVPWLIAELMVR
jgi:hypothetical protein